MLNSGFDFDNLINWLWNRLNVSKQGVVCQEEKFTRYGGVSDRHGDTGTKSFRSGIRVTCRVLGGAE